MFDPAMAQPGLTAPSDVCKGGAGLDGWSEMLQCEPHGRLQRGRGTEWLELGDVILNPWFRVSYRLFLLMVNVGTWAWAI